MIVNNTCVPVNGTCLLPGASSSYSVGLAVSLTIFFLLLVVAVIGGLVYKYHGAIRTLIRFENRRSQKMEESMETPQTDPHTYTGLQRNVSVGQAPIYENLSTQNKRYMNKDWSPSEPEEDVYLQCDSPDDAIYSNDPACNLSIIPDPHEEDVYIVPDS